MATAAPPWVLAGVDLVHRWVLGLRTGPPDPRVPVPGWGLLRHEPGIIVYGTAGGLITPRIVLTAEDDRAVVTTIMRTEHRLAPAVVAVIAPLHRLVARVLTDRVAHVARLAHAGATSTPATSTPASPGPATPAPVTPAPATPTGAGRRWLVAAVLDEGIEAHRAAIDTEFGGIDELLTSAHYRWWNSFHAHLDAVLEDPGDDLAGAVAALWRAHADRHPALRRLLDAHAARPALAAAEHAQRLRLHRELRVQPETSTDAHATSSTAHVAGAISRGPGPA